MEIKNYILEQKSLHIWSLSLDEELPNAYGQHLSSEEREKANRFRFAKDRDMYIFSHGVLRILLSRYLKCNPNEISYESGACGKPYLKANSKLRFNLSHAGKMAVIALVEDVEIGVDVEKISSSIDILEVAPTVYCLPELKNLSALRAKDKKLLYFFELWTRKEAFIKGTGYGFSMPVSLTDVSVLSEQVAFLSKEIKVPEGFDKWLVQSFKTTTGYKAAVAFNEPLQDIQQFTWKG